MKLTNLSSLLALAVLAGGIMLTSAPAQADQPVWQLLGLSCLSDDASEPDNRAFMDVFCAEVSDLFGIPYHNIVVTRCPSDAAEGNNRPFGPGWFCTFECAENTTEYQCAAFVQPGDLP